ncbi:DUF6461 domain-containing protein [Streptomyces sp. NPDC048187]|uniref:DUF6461 domain-containing protein n=1 Tax=Streptomyces sp. NPDC048187 TaxID=3365509 RepID=UPI0037118341
MTSVTARDYAWIRSAALFGYLLDVGYTLSLVRGLAPRKVLQVLGAQDAGACTGVDALIERQDELVDPMDYWDESLLVGACEVSGDGWPWTLVLHIADGGMGMRPPLLEALSAGGRAVVHSSNGGKPLHFFHWYEDGKLRTTFEWPTARAGSTPDALNSLMCDVGLLGSEEECEPQGDVDHKAAVFALAERLTGVRVSEELLQRADYQLGLVSEDASP